MTTPVAVIGLVWYPANGAPLDLQRADLDMLFEITEGLDTLPGTRGDDHVLPFRSGLLPASRLADRRPVVAVGHVMGPSGATARAAFRAYVDELKSAIDPTSPPGILVATLEDGTLRWIRAVPRNLIGGDGFGSDFRSFSLEWESLDPMWHGSWGTLAMDAGYVLDDGEDLDTSAEVVVIPVSTAHEITVDTLGTAEVERIRVRITGPSVGAVSVEVLTAAGPVGFAFSTLTAGQELEVDNYARTVLLDGVARRDLLTLRAANRNGEFVRLLAHTNTVRVYGQPAEARILFVPTWL
jgi:hypothetical protein